MSTKNSPLLFHSSGAFIGLMSTQLETRCSSLSSRCCYECMECYTGVCGMLMKVFHVTPRSFLPEKLALCSRVAFFVFPGAGTVPAAQLWPPRLNKTLEFQKCFLKLIVHKNHVGNLVNMQINRLEGGSEILQFPGDANAVNLWTILWVSYALEDSTTDRGFWVWELHRAEPTWKPILFTSGLLYGRNKCSILFIFNWGHTGLWH